jgi:hypothetical protein
MEDLLGLDQAAGDLLAAGGLMGRPAAVLPAGGRAGTFGDRIAERGEFAAGLRQVIGGLIVLNVGKEPQVGGIEPRLSAVGAPALRELAEGLVDQAEIDAIFAAGVAGGLENAHIAEPGDFIEQEQQPAAAQEAAGLIDGVEQGAEDDAGGLRTRLQDLERQVDEDVELAGEQMEGKTRNGILSTLSGPPRTTMQGERA